MTSEKVDYGRRAHMLQVAAEAPAILASETDRLQNGRWPYKSTFLHDYPAFSNDGRPWEDDDQHIDLMALVVLDDFPAETLDEILRINAEAASEPYLWLADTYDTLSDWDPAHQAEGSSGPVDKSWRSPFIGSSLQEVAAFITAAPKPPKPLCKRFFAVLQKVRYEQDKQLLICRIPENTTESVDKFKLQTVPCPIDLAGLFFAGYDRLQYWDRAVEEQALYYNEGASWSDDNANNQVMALIVLDEFPTETINKILDDNFEDVEERHLWLADTYVSLPDCRPNRRVYGTQSPISEDWRSPFVGKTIADAANFIRNAPKPPKPLCKRFFAVLQKDLFDESERVLICRISPGDDLDQIERGGDIERDVQRFKDAGRSLICKIDPAEQGNIEVDRQASAVTSAMGNINLVTPSDAYESSRENGKGEFKVEMISCEAAYVALFFTGFDRYSWWEVGGGDI